MGLSKPIVLPGAMNSKPGFWTKFSALRCAQSDGVSDTQTAQNTTRRIAAVGKMDFIGIVLLVKTKLPVRKQLTKMKQIAVNQQQNI